ncbi:SPRY domain-containing protein 4-like [Myotis myotis]|uniref:SPRY domain-containing protein 4-like n=1 Tax=Myotis myotis TaxID=51298 RepID=UPI00174E5E26|nr:SPRY domain-containing protein 4-like [Myotis myotis]
MFSENGVIDIQRIYLKKFARSPCLCRWGAKQLGVATAEARRGVSFKLEEKTAHSSLALFKDDTGVKYGMMALEPTKLVLNVEHFREWAVVLADTVVTSGRHYWEVTVKRSQQFRIGVADVDISRNNCIGVDNRSWVLTYAQRKWQTMLANKAPIKGIGHPETVGLLLEYEAQKLSLVDVSRVAVVHMLQTDFQGPVVPAFALWDGELLTHSGLEVPTGL